MMFRSDACLRRFRNVRLIWRKPQTSWQLSFASRTSQIKSFGIKHKVALVAGGGAAGTVVGYKSGKKKGIHAAIKGYEKTILASSAKELGYKSFRQVRNLPIEQKREIATRSAKKYMKHARDFITFYN